MVRHGECLAQVKPANAYEPVSDLSTNLLAEAAGIVAIEVEPELREGWLGGYQGHSPAELQRRFPRALMPHSMSDAGWSYASDETYQELFARAAGAAGRLRTSFAPAGRVAVVSHGGLLNYLLNALLDISPATPHWFELANGAISHARLVPDPPAERPDWPLYPPVNCEVLSLNDRAHQL